MKVSKSTIIRTIVLALVLINMILKAFGVDPLGISESQVASAVELIIEVGSIVAAWWYNNSYSKNALKAQEYLEKLREEGNDNG